MEQKLCLHCDKGIIGRADKKFCDNQCRNEYNNTQNSISNNYIRKVNRIIKKKQKHTRRAHSKRQVDKGSSQRTR